MNDGSHLQVLVNEYIHGSENSCCNYDKEDQWWGDKSLTWNGAVERAWKSRLWDGKMHSHQCRVANKLSEGLEIALADPVQPESFKDFQGLHDWVKSVTNRVYGLGATAAYDVARRLGAWLGLELVVVYLHAGTATGARKLGVKGKTARLSAFPKEIQALGTTHAENCLCIYKDRIP